MDNKKLPATPESRNALYENMGKTIESFSPILKENIIIKETLDEAVDNKASKILDALLSLNIYVLFTNIELASVLRASFRANLPAEKRYNLKWINCVILEAYKHLYGYGVKRKKSLWVSSIKPLFEAVGNLEFKQDFNALENHILEFGKSNVTNVKKRNLSFHYDIEPISVYDMLLELSEEEEAQRIICFMKLLQDISLFITKHIIEYAVPINVESKELLKFAFTFSDFDIFQNNREKVYSTMEETILSHSQRLDTFIRQQSLPELIKQQFKDIDSDFMDAIHRIIEIQKVAIQLTYLYIDLASATRAFIGSEHTIEKQLSLKQVNTIIIEGYNKLYGLNNDSEESFWKAYVYPIISDNEDELIIDEFKSIDEELLSLKIKVKTFEDQRQLSVHLDNGIPEVYSMLHNLDPVKEFIKVLQILNILPRVLSFLSKCLSIINLKNQANHEKKMAPTYEKIDNIISLLMKTPSTQEKDDFIQILERFKTGEFFDELKRSMQK